MSRTVPLLLLLALLAGCIYLPQKTGVYNPACGTTVKHMKLSSEQLGVFLVCNHEVCAALLVLAGVVSAASAVVSGSIVVIGNAVYWLENQINCPVPAEDGHAQEKGPEQR